MVALFNAVAGFVAGVTMFSAGLRLNHWQYWVIVAVLVALVAVNSWR